MSFNHIQNKNLLDKSVFFPFKGRSLEEQISSKFVRGVKASKGIPIGEDQPLSFGEYRDDYVEFSMYTDEDRIVHWSMKKDFKIDYDGNILLDVYKHFESDEHLWDHPNYVVRYNFHRKVLGGSIGFKLFVEEISSSRTEMRVFPVMVGNDTTDEIWMEQFLSFFNTPFQQSVKNPYTDQNIEVSPEFKYVANFGYNILHHIINWTIDPNRPNSAIIKLYEPLSENISEGEEFWIVEEMARPYFDRMSVSRQRETRIGRLLKGPNYQIDFTVEEINDTGIQSWETLLSDDYTTTQQLVNEYLFGSEIEQAKLNIGFDDFSNFVHFSSAVDRLENWKYKLQLLESYQLEIESIESADDYDSSSHLKSLAKTNKDKISRIIGGFDAYEKWLYQSNHPSSYPKDDDNKLVRLEETEAVDWFDDMLDEAAVYDEKNNDNLVNNLPAFIKQDANNEQFLLFIGMMGHFFDLIWLYVKHMEYNSNRDEDILEFESLSKDLSHIISKSFGFELYNGFDIQELYKWAFNTNDKGEIYYVFSPLTGVEDDDTTVTYTVWPNYPFELGDNSNINEQRLSGEDVQKQVWRRLLNTLPHFVKNKGTKRSIKALLSCYGIPSTGLTIKEWGGTNVNHVPTLFEMEDYTHELNFYGRQHIETIWSKLAGTTVISSGTDWDDVMLTYKDQPKSVEIRFKTEYRGSNPITLLEIDDAVCVTLEPHPTKDKPWGEIKVQIKDSDGNVDVGYVADAPIFDGSYNMFLLSMRNEEPKLTYHFRKRSIFGNLMYSANGALDITNKHAEQWFDTSTSYIGGKPVSSFNNYQFLGTIDQFRFWRYDLPLEQFDEHTLAPFKYDWNNRYMIDNKAFLADKTLRLNRNLLLDVDFSTVNSLFFYEDTIYNESPNKNYIDNENEKIYGYGWDASEDQKYPYQYDVYYRINFVYSIKVGASALYNDKIRTEETNLLGPLSHDSSHEIGSLDQIIKDSPKLGIYFSPQQGINEDIIASLGIDDLNGLLGDPREVYDDDYGLLGMLNRKYWLKYDKPYDIPEYIRYIKNFNKAFFKQARKMVPERATLYDGLLLEPHILERYKKKRIKTEIDESSLEDTIEIRIKPDPSVIDDEVTLDVVEHMDQEGEYPYHEFEIDVFTEYRYAGYFDDCPNKVYRRIPYEDFLIDFIYPIQNEEIYTHREHFYVWGPNNVYGDPSRPLESPYEGQPPYVGVYNKCSFYSEDPLYIISPLGDLIIKPPRAYERYRHYIYNREWLTADKRMKYEGVVQDSSTTLDNGPAVEVTFTSPERLIVSPTDKDNQGPILDVE